MSSDGKGRRPEAFPALGGTLFNVYNEREYVLRVLFRPTQRQ